MKIKHKMRLRKTVSAILAALMSMSVFSAVPVYAETSSATYTYDGYKVDYTVTNEWFGNQSVNVTLTNTSDESILNWALGYDANGEINGIWNGYVYSQTDDDYIIKNSGYNYEIEPYRSVNFGYTLSGDELEVPEKFKLCSKRVDKTDGYDVKLNVTGEWNDGFQGELVITNTSDAPIEAWKLDFDGNFTINNLWNGKVLESTDSEYSVASYMWTNPITSGNSTIVGFTANKENGEVPAMSDIKLSEVIIDKNGTPSTEDPVDPEPTEQLEISAEAQYVEADNTAVVTWNTNIVGGTFDVLFSADNIEYTEIAKVSDVNSYVYALGDINGTVYFKVRQTTSEGQTAESAVVSVDIPVPVVPEKPVITASADYGAETGFVNVSWETTVSGGSFDIYVSVNDGEFEKIGTVTDVTSYSFTPEVSGSYKVKVVQTTAAETVGESVAVTVECVISEPVPDIDWEDETDTDKDGLTDVYEKNYFETDPENADTDGDGLPDGYEIYYLGTDPKKTDSDDNGVNDGEEDFDKDGLNNLREYELGTDPNNADSDWDGLTDSDEVNTYGTDPLKYDTDGDSISDGDEIALELDPTSASTNGVPDSERTFVQHIGADSEVFSAVNTDENPYKVSIDITAAGVAENNLYSKESGYSNAIKNDAILGISPEFVYTDGLNVEDVVINFDIDSSAVSNTNGKYTSLSDEFVGIKRLNVFKFFEDTNMLLPIETFHDVENDRVYTHVDELGTYCLMDMEIWLESLGITAEDTANDANVAAISAGSFAVASVNVLNATSNNASEEVNTDSENEDEKSEYLDVVLVTYPNKSLLDETKSELKTTCKSIYEQAQSDNIDVRIFFVSFLGSSITTPDGNIYACNYVEAEEIINRHAGITYAHDENTYALYKALNYTAKNCVPQFREDSDRFCFVIDVCGYPRVDSGIGAISTFNENNVRLSFSYNTNNTNELDYSLLSSGACEPAVVGGGRYNFEDFIIREIFGNHENEYPIISAVGWKRINLDAPITEEDRSYAFAIENDPTLHDGVVALNRFADTDEDELLDLEELMFQTEDGRDLITFDDNGNVILPNFEDCTGALQQNRRIFYVEEGLRRYADVAKFQDLFKFRILPIRSDPTSEDGDGDGILDVNEKWNGIDERYEYIYPLKTDTIETLYSELKFANANGTNNRFFVEIKDNTILLNVRISQNLKQEEKNWIKQALNKYWAGEYRGNKYDFYEGMTISVKTNLIEDNPLNCINVFFEKTVDESERSYTRHLLPNKPVKIYYTGSEPDLYVIAHEFGHVFGLGDAYLELDPSKAIYHNIWNTNYALMPFNFNDDRHEINPITEIMITNEAVCSNDIEMILEGRLRGDLQYFFKGHCTSLSEAIKSPYLLYMSYDYELYYYDNSNNTTNKVMTIINSDLYKSKEYSVLYRYGEKYFSFLLSYKNWIDSFYPQYSIGIIELHEYLTDNLIVSRNGIDSIFQKPNIHYRQAFEENGCVRICSPIYNASDAVQLLQDGYSVWVESEEYLFELIEAGKDFGIKYMDEHEFTFLGNFQWGSCINQSHVHITFDNNGFYTQFLCVYIGRNEMFEFDE